MLREEHFNNKCPTAGNPTTFAENSFAPSCLNIFLVTIQIAAFYIPIFFKDKKCQLKKIK